MFGWARDALSESVQKIALDYPRQNCALAVPTPVYENVISLNKGSYMKFVKLDAFTYVAMLDGKPVSAIYEINEGIVFSVRTYFGMQRCIAELGTNINNIKRTIKRSFDREPKLS